MVKRARWLALALVALVLGLLQMPGIAVASPTLSTVVSAYGTLGYGQSANYTATERGPQATTNDYTVRSAVEDHSQGTSACPEVAAGHRYTTYDEAVVLASVARTMGAGQGTVPPTGRDLLSLQRSRVAAETGAAARGLSSVGNQNVRVLRNWANSKGWVRQAGDGPEVWGVRNTDGSFSWRLKLKPEASTRPGLEAGSKVPRFDARLGPGEYVNPFTGEVGGRAAGTHIPLEYQWIP